MKILALVGLVLSFGWSAFATESWNLTSDWNPSANPNGVWTYGDYDSNSFVKLAYVPDTDMGGVGGYLPTSGTESNGIVEPDGFIYKNFMGSAGYGVDPGQVSMASDWGTPVTRWTAPTSGLYDISVAIGGTTVVEGPGFGNNFAPFAGLNINMIKQTNGILVSNIMTWAITNILLNAGTTVDAYVPYQGYAWGGNTQTKFQVSAVQTALLAIAYTNNAVTISWSSLLTGLSLQTNSNLGTTNWGKFNGTLTTANGTNSAAIKLLTNSLFFRLANL